MQFSHCDCRLGVVLQNHACDLPLASVSTPSNCSKSAAKVDAEAASPHGGGYYNPSLSLLMRVSTQGSKSGLLPRGCPWSLKDRAPHLDVACQLLTS
jgi:hypothetical protein